MLGIPKTVPNPPWLPTPPVTITLRVLLNVAGLYLSLRKIADGPGTSVDDLPPRSTWKAPLVCGSGYYFLVRMYRMTTCPGFHCSVPVRIGTTSLWLVLSLAVKPLPAVKVCDVPFLTAIWSKL